MNFLSALIIGFFFFLSPTLAADVTITCTDSDCTSSTSDPIFYEINILPGYHISRQLTVVNQRSDTCNLVFRAVNPQIDILADKVNISVLAGSTLYYSGTISHLTTSSILYPLGSIPASSSQIYDWKAVFDSNAGNEYQNKKSVFDLDFIFECDENNLSPTSTPVPTTDNNPPSVCNDSYPQAPTRLYTVRNTTGSITLHWTQTTSPHTGYLVAFGVQPGVYLYGAPDVGNVAFYTVRGLTYGAQYCFYVRSLNGCMPGDRTTEVCANPGGPVIPPTTPPAGFIENVLGEQTEVTFPQVGDIEGLATSVCQRRWLPILYFIALLLNLFIFHRRIRLRYLISFIISLLLFIIDFYILRSRCCLIFESYCRYFWIGNMFSYFIPILIFNKNKV